MNKEFVCEQLKFAWDSGNLESDTTEGELVVGGKLWFYDERNRVVVGVYVQGEYGIWLELGLWEFDNCSPRDQLKLGFIPS